MTTIETDTCQRCGAQETAPLLLDLQGDEQTATVSTLCKACLKVALDDFEALKAEEARLLKLGTHPRIVEAIMDRLVSEKLEDQKEPK